MLKVDDELKDAYTLKEMYFKFIAATEDDLKDTEDFFEKKGKTKVELHHERLDDIIEAMENSQINEFKKCANTLQKWKEEILNSFVWFDGRRFSNGVIEGKNNYIKKILNNANGYRNFERARNKIMYSQNKYEHYSLSEHKTKKKKKKTKKGTKK
ncbi:hypothetical protein A4S06_11420 [Erysipelotrichaceae bacterium MTC7]|nr:hypothetical protein A4S06_11420 [Erysipelotrichaceae bacterium MTC7]